MKLKNGEQREIGRHGNVVTHIERSGNGQTVRWVRTTLDAKGRAASVEVFKTAAY